MLGDWGKLIVAKGFKKLPKVQKIARSGHTGHQVVFLGSGANIVKLFAATHCFKNRENVKIVFVKRPSPASFLLLFISFDIILQIELFRCWSSTTTMAPKYDKN